MCRATPCEPAGAGSPRAGLLERRLAITPKRIRVTPLTIAPAALTLAAGSAGAPADDKITMEKMLESGGEVLDAGEIDHRFAGKTATFPPSTGGKRQSTYFAPDNTLAGEIPARSWEGTGAWEVDGNDRLCVDWVADGQGRRVCVQIVAFNGMLHKFRPDGARAATVLACEDGRKF